jgi:hypothetical protein
VDDVLLAGDLLEVLERHDEEHGLIIERLDLNDKPVALR